MGLVGINNLLKNMKIENLQVLPGLTLLRKIRKFLFANLDIKVEKTPFLVTLRGLKGIRGV